MCVCVCVCVCVRACVRAHVHVCMCIIIIPRENRGIKNQEKCINYGDEVEEKGLITDTCITYLETSVCHYRDFDMVLAIYFLTLVVLAIVLLLNPVLS